jgi:hypothetical protein
MGVPPMLKKPISPPRRRDAEKKNQCLATVPIQVNGSEKELNIDRQD